MGVGPSRRAGWAGVCSPGLAAEFPSLMGWRACPNRSGVGNFRPLGSCSPLGLVPPFFPSLWCHALRQVIAAPMTLAFFLFFLDWNA